MCALLPYDIGRGIDRRGNGHVFRFSAYDVRGPASDQHAPGSRGTVPVRHVLEQGGVMHIDWFIVYIFGVTAALVWYGLWLSGKVKNGSHKGEEPGDSNQDSASH